MSGNTEESVDVCPSSLIFSFLVVHSNKPAVSALPSKSPDDTGSLVGILAYCGAGAEALTYLLAKASVRHG